MTSLALYAPTSTLAMAGDGHRAFWSNSLAATLALALHGAVLALLVYGWAPDTPAAVEPTRTLATQLVMLPPAAPPEVAPPAAVLPAPAEPAPVAPVAPQVDPLLQAQKLEHAALARKRVAEQKREQQAQQQRARDAEQQRLAQQREAQQQQAQAEQARAAAERSRQQAAQAQAASASRQYLPLSKEAPDYPQRALDKGIEGDCTVEYSVSPQGKVEAPKVVGNCHPAFIRPSLVAAATFRYKPRVVDGQPVSVSGVRNTFHYRIQ